MNTNCYFGLFARIKYKHIVKQFGFCSYTGELRGKNFSTFILPLQGLGMPAMSVNRAQHMPDHDTTFSWAKGRPRASTQPPSPIQLTTTNIITQKNTTLKYIRGQFTRKWEIIGYPIKSKFSS